MSYVFLLKDDSSTSLFLKIITEQKVTESNVINFIYDRLLDNIEIIEKKNSIIQAIHDYNLRVYPKKYSLEWFRNGEPEKSKSSKITIGYLHNKINSILKPIKFYTIMVLFTDGYLACKKSPLKITRFLKICTQLPLELQMVLAYRMTRSYKTLIPTKSLDYTLASLLN